MSFGGRHPGRPGRDDPDSQGPATSATSDGEGHAEATSGPDLETTGEESRHVPEEEEEEESPVELSQMSAHHIIPDSAVSSNQRGLVSQGEPSLSQVAWPTVGGVIAGVRRGRDRVVPSNTTDSDSQQEYPLPKNCPGVGVPTVEDPTASRLSSVTSPIISEDGFHPPSASSHYDSHSAGIQQVPEVLPSEAQLPPQYSLVVEHPYINTSLPDTAAWERAAEPSPPSSGDHTQRRPPNQRAERPVNWDTDSSSYPPTCSSTTSGSTSSRTLPSLSSSRDTTVSDLPSYPTSSSSTHRSSSSLSSTASQQHHGRAGTSSSGGLGDVSETSEPMDHSAEDGELFHPPTQTPRLPEVTQLDVRMLTPRSNVKKTSDESTTTSSSSCGPPQRVGAVMALQDSPQREEGRGRPEQGRGSEGEGSSDLSRGEMQTGGVQGESPTSYKLPGWIQQQPVPEEEPSQPLESDHHGNRKRPAPQGSLPALLPPAKVTKTDHSELPIVDTSGSEQSPEGCDGSSEQQADLPRWIAEERKMRRQLDGSSGHQHLVKGSGSGTGGSGSGTGGSGSGSSSSAARLSMVPVQHSTPSHSRGSVVESPESVVLAEGEKQVLAPETVEGQSCGRGHAAPSSVCHQSADSSVLVPDTPLGSADMLVGRGADSTLTVPDTQDSLSSSFVQIREESKEEDELFSAEVLTVDTTAPPSSFSLQLSQLSVAPDSSQQDLSASTQAIGESAQATGESTQTTGESTQTTGESTVNKDSSSSATSSSGESAGTRKSSNRPSSSGSSSDGADAGMTGGGGTTAVGGGGGGGGGGTTSEGADSTQEQGGQDQQSSQQDSVLVLGDGSIFVASDVKQSGEVPVGANKDVIVLSDSLTMEVQGTSMTVHEVAPAIDDYEGDTLPYSATVEGEVAGDGEGSPASKGEGEGGVVQEVIASDCCAEPESSSGNPFQFTTTRSPSKRTDHVEQSTCEVSPLEQMEVEGSGRQGNPVDVAIETEHQVVASAVGRQGSFLLAAEHREQQQSTADSEFVLPAIQVQNESQSQFQDAFLFQPSFKIDRPTVPMTYSVSALPQTPPTFTGRLATLPDQMPPLADPYMFTSQDGPFPEGTTPQLPGLTTTSLHTSQSPLPSCAPVVDAFDKSLCGKYVTRKTVVTRQVTQTVKEVTTECIKDGVVLSKTVLEVCDEPPKVSTHSTFGLFVDDTHFLTEVSLVGTPPLPSGVSTPTAGTPIVDQPHLHSTPKSRQPVSEEPTDTTASGATAPRPSSRRTPKGKGRKKKCAQLLDENPLGNTSCASTSSTISDPGRSGDILVGSRVLTKWEDGLWFPGHVSAVGDDKSVDVEFDDGESGSAPLKDVIVMDHPLPNGLEVLVKPSRSQRHIKGVVKGCPGNSPNGPYIVTYLKASGKFCLSEIVLVNKQALRFASLSKVSQGAGPSSRRGTASLMTKQKVATTSGFFTGKFFVLTTSKEQEGEKSYDRDSLTSDIVGHGGMVVGSPLEVGGDMDGVFCVSDGPCRKRKFLLALAVGMPCVSFQFVLECVQKKRLVNFEDYLLPVGVSSTTGERVAWTPVCPGTIFEGVNVLVVGDESFKNQWEEILCAAGAHILGRLSLTSGGSLSGDSSSAANPTVVVHQPPSHRQQSVDVSAILRRAEGLGIPAVQVDWAVESLMHRRRMALDRR